MESNRVEKVLKEVLAVVIEECKMSCGERNTGYLLQAVTSGAGAGPILDEGTTVTFARMSRPRGRQTVDEREADTDQRSEMEGAFLQAKEPGFRHDPAFVKFRDALASCVDETHAWPILDTEAAGGEGEIPEAGPAPEAAPASVDKEPTDAVMEPVAPEAGQKAEDPAAVESKGGHVSRLVSRFTKAAEAVK